MKTGAGGIKKPVADSGGVWAIICDGACAEKLGATREVMMQRHLLWRLILAAMVLALLLIACGSPAETAAPTAPGTATAEPTTVTARPTPADATEVPRLTPQELKDRLDNGDDILVMDTRGQLSYDNKHIAGAIVRPETFDDIAHDQEIVLYCA